MKMVTLASTIVTLANVAHAGMTEPELAFRDAARTIAKTAKVDLASHARALDTGLRDLLHATAASGDVAAAVDAAYDLVLDRYAAAHGDVLRAATELRAAGGWNRVPDGRLANALAGASPGGGPRTRDALGGAAAHGRPPAVTSSLQRTKVSVETCITLATSLPRTLPASSSVWVTLTR